MKKSMITVLSLMWLVPATLLGCSQTETPNTQTPEGETSSAETAQPVATNAPMGVLELKAQGEDFIQKGIVSKDGWKINFDNVYLNFVDINAYQTEQPYNPETGGEIKAKEKVLLIKDRIIDLTEGKATAAPVFVASGPAPAGQYNALSWKMTKGTEGPVIGQAMVMVGTATKDGETIPFTLKVDKELQFTCGDYVGETRKGLLEAGNKADLEMTFHLDHLFGDSSLPATDPVNQDAMGFEPLTSLVENGKLDVDTSQLQVRLSEADYQKFEKQLLNFAHVGEGHCQGSVAVSQ